MARKKRPPVQGSQNTGRRHNVAKGLLLNLTGNERSALLECPRLRPMTRKKVREASDEAVRFTKNELIQILAQIGAEFDFGAATVSMPLLKMLRQRVINLLEEDAPDGFGAEYLKGRAKTRKRTDLFFQFRIKLADIAPSVWRRIQVPDCTLAALHVCIQAVFGWEDYHLHEFVIGGMRFGPPPPDDFMDFGPAVEDETKPRISQLVPQSGKQSQWTYVYDFGDEWRHEIAYEGCGPLARGTKYPLCLEGARACPPEDVGGPWGYAELLAAIGESQHERHEELLDWLGEFDPEAFDATEATTQMRKWARQVLKS